MRCSGQDLRQNLVSNPILKDKLGPGGKKWKTCGAEREPLALSSDSMAAATSPT